VKALWWILCAAALAVSAWFGLRARGQNTVVVQGGPAPSASPSALVPCPPRTLLDEGACVPLPKPMAAIDIVPRLPSRPAEYSAYVLPASGTALMGTWADLDADLAPRLTGAALILAAAEGAPVYAPTLGGQPVRIRERGEHWLILETAAVDDAAKGDRWVAVLGPLSVDSKAVPGQALAAGTELGRAVPGGIGFAVRRLRPNEVLGADLEKWGSGVWVDARNALPLVASAAPSNTAAPP
jgi:hypothetical protein